MARRVITKTYFGQEPVARPRRLALMNLFLHGLEPTIFLGDTIYEAPPAQRFDIILTNPPFGTKGANQMPDRVGVARKWEPRWQTCYNRITMNDRITIDPAILLGKPIIRGTRISVEFVVGLLANGWTVDDVLKEYTHLAPEDVQACLAYAHQLLADERIYPVPA